MGDVIDLKLKRFAEATHDLDDLAGRIRELDRVAVEDLRRLETRLVEVGRTLGLNERRALGTLVGHLTAREGHRRGLRQLTQELGNLWRNIRMIGRSPEVDEFGFDPVFAEVVYPLIDFIFERYFRVELEGIDRLPKEGPALLVCNHAGTLPLDALLVAHAVRYKVFPPRPCRSLVEDIFVNRPFLGPLLARTGLVRADRRNAARLLNLGRFVTVFPEGLKGLGKYYQHRYQLQRFGRGGYVRVALACGAPIIPVAIIGHEETYPIVAKLDSIGRIFGLPFAPLTINMLFGGIAGVLPLPSRWRVIFGEPYDMSGCDVPSAAEVGDLVVNRVNQEVRAELQRVIDQAVAQRGSVWLG